MQATLLTLLGDKSGAFTPYRKASFMRFQNDDILMGGIVDDIKGMFKPGAYNISTPSGTFSLDTTGKAVTVPQTLTNAGGLMKNPLFWGGLALGAFILMSGKRKR